MRTTPIIILAAAAALVAQGWWNDRQLDQLAQAAPRAGHLDELQRRLRAMEARADEDAARPLPAAPLAPAATPRPSAPAAEGTPADDVAPTVEDAAPPTSREPPLPPPRRLENAYVQEHADPAWAEATADQIVESWTAQLPAGSSIADIECRTTLCRVEVRHEGEAGHAAILDAVVGGTFFWSGAGSFELEQDPGGPPRSVAYLAREGVDAWAQTR